jgi:integrase
MPRGTKDGSIVRLDKNGRVTQSAKDTVRFVIKKRYTDLQGRSREKKRIAYSATESLRQKRAIDREIENELAGVPKPNASRTVSDAIAWCNKHRFKPAVYVGSVKVAGQRTWKATRNALKPVEAFMGDMAIMKVTYDDFADYKEERLRAPVVIPRVKFEAVGGVRTRVDYIETRQRAIGTVNRELAWAHCVFQVALRKKWITENPFDQGAPLIQVSIESKHERILSYPEQVRLFAAFEAQKRGHLPFAVTFALETAMRKEEQFRLDRFEDVDLEGRLLTALSYKGKRTIRRLVPITEVLMPQLVEHLASHSNQQVFEINDPKKSFANSCEDAGIEGVTWHSLRHTAITRMVHVYKIPPMDVMKISGHTNWKTFFETYVNVDEDMVRSIGAAIDSARTDPTVADLERFELNPLVTETPQ